MYRKLLSALVGGASLIATTAFAPMSAPLAPAGGCPAGGDWNLAPVSAAIPAIDNGNYSDNNGDGLGCFRVNKGQSDKYHVSAWTWKDNTN